MHDVNKYALRLLLVAIGVGLSAFVEGMCWARTAERQASRMKMEYLKSVLRQEIGFFDSQTAGTSTTYQVVSLISSDANTIQVALCEKENIPIEEVFENLRCSREGLSSKAAEERLAIFGHNKPYFTDNAAAALMARLAPKAKSIFGVHVEHSGNWDRFLVHGGQKYKSPGNAFVEGDASSASYFLAGAAVTGGTITVVGCGTSSLQNHPAIVVPRLPTGLNLFSLGDVKINFQCGA
ncbi:hypothetical protein HN873_032313 [Arachis hypogaea]